MQTPSPKRLAARARITRTSENGCNSASGKIFQYALAMLVGYDRVSTRDQQPELQRDALEKAGCEKLFTDVASGATSQREGLEAGLEAGLEFVRTGDTLVVWKSHRLGRSLKDLIERIGELQARGVGFESVQKNIDTLEQAELMARNNTNPA